MRRCGSDTGKRTEECGSEPGHGGNRFHRVSGHRRMPFRWLWQYCRCLTCQVCYFTLLRVRRNFWMTHLFLNGQPLAIFIGFGVIPICYRAIAITLLRVQVAKKGSMLVSVGHGICFRSSEQSNPSQRDAKRQMSFSMIEPFC